MANFIDKLFNTEGRHLKEIEKRIEPVLALEETYRNMSDDELKAMTPKLKERLANGETLNDIQVEAFATVREAARRVIGEYPYKVQLMGAAVMQDGDIAEMKTGEGKTLTSIMAVYLNALEGKGVHVITVNEYLAKRDSEWMGEIHRFLGLTVGLNLRQLTPVQKRQAYMCDITYTTNAEVGFDYLRYNMVTRVQDRVLRGLHFALVDEVDSILIDESRTPLIISGGQKQTANLYLQADRFAKSLTKDVDYMIDEKGRTCTLTEEGIAKGEKMFKLENLYHLENTALLHHIQQALKANYIMVRDVEYVVDTENDEIVIVDQNTGRMMHGRAYSDGLHQAIEAKEGITIKQETTTLATITYQNFFRLYDKLAGMTGTAKTEEEEFLDIYNMRVIEIPTNVPVQRIDAPDLVFGTKKAKFEALVDEIIRRHQTGQPILVGTISVETSEHLSKMLDSRKIRHNVLNAKNHQREAEIIAHAGRQGAVTIATNMAGRGTDIKLGEGVKELGGLCVLGSERHESRRIDNQLRGRSGRQGDPGYSQFYVSLGDDLMIRFGSDRFSDMIDSLGDVVIESKTLTKAIGSAQRQAEGRNYDARKTLLDYDNVLAQQREIIYRQRDEILENDDVHSVVKGMFSRVVNNMVASYVDYTLKNPAVDVPAMLEGFKKIGFKETIDAAELEGKSTEEIVKIMDDKAWAEYENKIEPYKDQILPLEKDMTLRMFDRAWVDHIDTMSKLRDGIHLRSYAQNNPLQAYVEEGYAMFDAMLQHIADDVVGFCLKLSIVVRDQNGKEVKRV